ncbi:DUF2975 domain-containing protein [Vaginisenegalia massiliensis]|uniref:DUF2975 domain-containing protein n=1 Tax=Vaginisenegalia massiliensis TaxID=2058294 RepID=UPI0013DE7670|nr:DUF2975 domain-containing protein [Vaginisenegalia massiliensis]
MNETNQQQQMNHENTSILLTKICLAIFFIVAILMLFNGPYLVAQFDGRSTPLFGGDLRRNLLLLSGYICGGLALLFISSFYRLIDRIGRDQVFTSENVTCLRYIGWEIQVVTLIALIMGLTCYLPLLAIAVAGGFMVLVLRVVRNAFGKAVAMQDELTYTI